MPAAVSLLEASRPALSSAVFFAGQLFAQGVQRPALAAGGGTVGRKISPAGLGLGVFCGGVAGCQLFVLALSGGKMLLPGARPGGGFLSTGQQGSASVDEGFRFLLGSFAAIVHDLFQRGGAGLGFSQHGVEGFSSSTRSPCKASRSSSG